MLPREAPLGRRPAGPAARTLVAATLAAVAVAAAACGSDDPSPAGGGGAEIELRVTLDADGKGGDPERTARVSCQEPACPSAAAELSAADFEPVGADVACTEIYGGPDLATVEGTLDGEPVEAQLTRANGCEIERFDRFAALLRSLFDGYQPGAALQP